MECSRQDEIKYLASLDEVKNLNEDEIEHLLIQISENNGFYDTIYFVNDEGTGIVGVSYDGQTTPIRGDDARKFQVDDRSWFQNAIEGNNVFSQPLVSHSTGNRVSNVVIPVRSNDEIIGVVRTAVLLETLTNRLAEFEWAEGTEVFLIDKQGEPVSDALSLQGVEVVSTFAAEEISEEQTSVNIYPNAAIQL